MRRLAGIGLAAILAAALAGSAWAEGQGKPVTPGWQVLTKNTVYTKDKPPAEPKLEDLPERESVTQYGITWTFEKPARVGQFVNGDFYVVGPVTVKALDPKPLYGADVPESEVNATQEKNAQQRVRNGFMLNPPAKPEVAYDSGTKNFFRPALIGKLPAAMKPGDSLVATISMLKGIKINSQLKGTYERGAGDASPTRISAVLTCVAAPQPPDAFRPAFCDRQAKIYLARDLKRDLLPTLAATKSIPKIAEYAGFTQKPWVGTGFFTFEQPMENMPGYGRKTRSPSSSTSSRWASTWGRWSAEGIPAGRASAATAAGGNCPSSLPGWSWGTSSWPTSTRTSRRRPSARTSRRPTAIAGRARRSCSPGTGPSTSGRGSRGAGPAPTSRSSPRTGRASRAGPRGRATSAASRIAAAARAAPGPRWPWSCTS